MAGEIDFNRDIRPILSDRCFLCHGPNEESNDSGLRLDSFSAATGELPSGEEIAIVPGDPEASVALQRILSDDDSVRMPPPGKNLEISEAEKQLLREWIEQGAEYKKHWAFEPLPAVVPVPKVSVSNEASAGWPRNPIDAFVLARLEKEQLKPSAEAERWRWLRRATFDLTGLPPTRAEIEAFEHDHSATSHETVVDRLLESEHFGEQMAVAWLDAARYADSYGYQSDMLNTQWPYRDWVVRAFNQNLPYDQFLIWQLAGDLLPDPTRDQRLATAFNRLHRLNNEGGAVFEEWRVENVADRVHTFGTALLGLTLECSRCHDHKYDPITQRDYYSISAFFNSIDENGLYDNTEKVPSPTMLLPTPEQEVALAMARRQMRKAENTYVLALKNVKPRLQVWQDAPPSAELSIPDRRLALDFDTPFDDSKKEIYYPSTNGKDRVNPWPLVEVPDCDIPRLSPSVGARKALTLDGDRGVSIVGIERFERWTPFSVIVTLRETQRVSQRAVIAHHTAGTDVGYNGWDLTIAGGHVESRLYRVWPGNAIGVRSSEPILVDEWHQLAATYDGSSRASGLRLFLDGKPIVTEILRDQTLLKRANPKSSHGGGGFVLGQRFRDRGLSGGLIDDLRIFSRDLSETELWHLASGASLEKTESHFVSAIDEKCRAAAEALQVARKSVVLAEEKMNEIPIMKELDEPRPAHLLARGQYDAPTSDETLVPRDTFENIQPAFPADAPRDRLGLAQWATRPDHPLTARVAVNRLWGNFFGEGLVGTPENFGLQGDSPTHPQLLDWLSRDFVEHSWDIKRLCRNIVLSATYRQTSATMAKLLKVDPKNRLLARGPAYRLSAEQIRDMALATSGLFNPEQGGPPVSPYQPGGDLWRESNTMSPSYKQSVGQALYRRSLYSVWKRTAPLPNMMAFDSTTREVCSVKRSRTNTPLQALVLLNDVQFLEACRNLAQRVLSDEQEDAARVTAVFLAFTGRVPDDLERDTLLKLLSEERDYFGSHPDNASKLLALGETPANSDIANDLLAAMTLVCQAVLNLDATIWKR